MERDGVNIKGFLADVVTKECRGRGAFRRFPVLQERLVCFREHPQNTFHSPDYGFHKAPISLQTEHPRQADFLIMKKIANYFDLCMWPQNFLSQVHFIPPFPRGI